MRWKPHVRFGGRTGETGQHERLALRPGPTPTRGDCQAGRSARTADAFTDMVADALQSAVGCDTRTIAYRVDANGEPFAIRIIYRQRCSLRDET